MSDSSYHVRRATVDDLPALLRLWESMKLPVGELEKRLTEFQVVESGDGAIHGAIAMQIMGRNGKLHSEGFIDFAIAESVRPLLWQRMQSLATNHGLARLWTAEEAPFWKHNGFNMANEDALKKLPEEWSASGQKEWLTLRLRDEDALEISLDREFARFKEMEQARTQAALRRGRILKFIATIVAFILAVFVMVISVYVYLHRNSAHLLAR